VEDWRERTVGFFPFFSNLAEMSRLVRPHPRGREIDGHRLPVAEVRIASFADHRAHRRPPTYLHPASLIAAYYSVNGRTKVNRRGP
jgi:hypothetical protein